MKAEERNRIIAYSEEWRAFGAALGWRCYGFTEGDGASFLDSRNFVLHLTERQRDDILAMISRAVDGSAE